MTNAVAEKPKYKFRLLTGIHSENGKTYVAKRTQATYTNDHSGDIIETDSDLRKLNHPDPTARQKFSYISGDLEKEVTLDDVHTMNVAELKAFAEQEGIDIEGYSKKADLVELIQMTLAE